MVESANDYYKKGLHEAYRLFRDSPVFQKLRERYGNECNPTAQEIVKCLGVESTGKPHEGGLDSINCYLAEQNKPMLVRRGKWDAVEEERQQPTRTVSRDDAM